MYKSFSLILLLLASVAYAIEEPVWNPAADQDTVFKANDAGTVKDVMRIDASEGAIETAQGLITLDALGDDMTVESGETLVRRNLDVPSGKTLTVNGKLVVHGPLTGLGGLSGTGSATSGDPWRGDFVIGGDLDVTGDLDATGDLDVTGDTTLTQATITGSLGVGISGTPGAKVDAASSGSIAGRFSSEDLTPAGTPNTVFDDVVAGSTDTANTGMTIFGSGQAGIAFGDAANNIVGQIRYQHSNDQLQIITNGSEIYSSGVDSVANMEVRSETGMTFTLDYENNSTDQTFTVVSSVGQVILRLAETDEHVMMNAADWASSSNHICITSYSDAIQDLTQCSSSLRFKKDVEPISMVDSKAIYSIEGKEFTWKNNNEREVGVIAEEVHAVSPALVGYDDEGEPLNIKWDSVKVLMIEEMKKMRTWICAQDNPPQDMCD